MLLLSDFDYELPEERIAQVPVEPRNSSRLMVLDPVEKTIEHRHFYDLKEYVEPGDTLIFNDTRVMPARLIGHRDQTGGKWKSSCCAVLMQPIGKRWSSRARRLSRAIKSTSAMN